MDENFLISMRELFKRQIEELDEQERHLFTEEKIAQAVGDEVDMINSQQESDFLLRLHNRNKFLKRKIVHAINKTFDGTYGSCEECSQKISTGRLLARPTATLCIQCKEQQEKEEKEIFDRDHASVKLWNTSTTPNSQLPSLSLKSVVAGEA